MGHLDGWLAHLDGWLAVACGRSWLRDVKAAEGAWMRGGGCAILESNDGLVVSPAGCKVHRRDDGTFSCSFTGFVTNRCAATEKQISG